MADPSTDNLLFEERQRFPRWLFFLVPPVPLVLGAAQVARHGGLTHSVGPMAIILLVDAGALFAFALLFTGLRVRVTDRGLFARRFQGIGGVRLGPGDIEWCRAVRDAGLADVSKPLPKRTEWGALRGLLRGTETAVLLRTAGGFVVIGTEQPDACVQAIAAIGVRVLPPSEGLEASMRDGMSR